MHSRELGAQHGAERPVNESSFAPGRTESISGSGKRAQQTGRQVQRINKGVGAKDVICVLREREPSESSFLSLSSLPWVDLVRLEPKESWVHSRELIAQQLSESSTGRQAECSGRRRNAAESSTMRTAQIGTQAAGSAVPGLSACRLEGESTGFSSQTCTTDGMKGHVFFPASPHPKALAEGSGKATNKDMTVHRANEAGNQDGQVTQWKQCRKTKQWSDRIYRNRRHCKIRGLNRIRCNWCLREVSKFHHKSKPRAIAVSSIPPRWRGTVEDDSTAKRKTRKRRLRDATEPKIASKDRIRDSHPKFATESHNQKSHPKVATRGPEHTPQTRRNPGPDLYLLNVKGILRNRTKVS